MLSSIHCHLLILFGQKPSLIYPRTFTILPSATSTTPSLHERIWQDWDYHIVLVAPFALILNHSFMLSLVVNSTLIALPGDTTQSLTSLPSHFNLKLMFTLHKSDEKSDENKNTHFDPSFSTKQNVHTEISATPLL